MSRIPFALRPQYAVAGAAGLFGTSAVATQVVDHALSAWQVSAARIVVGALCLVAASACRGVAPWRYPLAGRRVSIGAAAVVGLQVGYFGAVDRLGVAAATVLTIGAGPVAAGLIDRCRHGIHLSSRWIGGVAFALIGIAAMSGGGWRFDAVGWASAIAGGACLPVYGGVARALMTDRPPIAAIATLFGAAVPAAAVIGVVASRDDGWPTAPAAVGVVTWVGVVATALAYVAWSIGLAGLTVRDSVVLTMLEPVTATLLAAWLLGEPLPWAGRLGMLAVVAGIVISSAPSRTPRAPAARSVRAARWAQPGRTRSDPIRR